MSSNPVIHAARTTKPIVTPNEVKGVLGHSVTNPPDRIFYILEETASHELLWEVDGYLIKDGKTGREHWNIHLICPKCRNANTIKSEAKQLQVTAEGLEVEPFRCAWPGEFGSPECGYRAALVLPPKNKRITHDQHGLQRRVDAMFKQA
jgi:hypothetical protein